MCKPDIIKTQQHVWWETATKIIYNRLRKGHPEKWRRTAQRVYVYV